MIERNNEVLLTFLQVFIRDVNVDICKCVNDFT